LAIGEGFAAGRGVSAARGLVLVTVMRPPAALFWPLVVLAVAALVGAAGAPIQFFPARSPQAPELCKALIFARLACG